MPLFFFAKFWVKHFKNSPISLPPTHLTIVNITRYRYYIYSHTKFQTIPYFIMMNANKSDEQQPRRRGHVASSLTAFQQVNLQTQANSLSLLYTHLDTPGALVAASHLFHTGWSWWWASAAHQHHHWLSWCLLIPPTYPYHIHALHLLLTLFWLRHCHANLLYAIAWFSTCHQQTMHHHSASTSDSPSPPPVATLTTIHYICHIYVLLSYTEQRHEQNKNTRNKNTTSRIVLQDQHSQNHHSIVQSLSSSDYITSLW